MSQKSFRTSQLWFQYMDMLDILRRCIKAERTGNWDLHLQTVKDMLPFLAASGHNLYVNSSRVYLQQMQNLKTTHPDVLAFLQSSYHVIRRSDKFWAGLSSDLVIEQVLMRSLKTHAELGIKILKSIDGQKIDECSFKRKEQAIILSAKSAIKVDDDVITVDSQLLFQRFLAASNGIYEDQSEIFTYELGSHQSTRGTVTA
ncbi:unnamed protein product [Mytilus coruscus]|uniref:Uncharacterized protein n=1 Tax=Mytilus coruscus TaxID=42192 RepID=A0A6J8BEL5_MYTCO|nr:unnamed protein product [Mytilus coruscus]